MNDYFINARGNGKSYTALNQFNMHVGNLHFDNMFKQSKLYDKIIFNNPATIVWWDDDTKTIVKSTEGDSYSKQFGFLMAYFQKHSGMTKTQVNKFMDKLEETPHIGGVLKHD